MDYDLAPCPKDCLCCVHPAFVAATDRAISDAIVAESQCEAARLTRKWEKLTERLTKRGDKTR